jgi:HNH endonuclease
MIKLPELIGRTRGGGSRLYQTKWVRGVVRRATKTARHKYYAVMYRGKNYKVHRLICEAFHGPPTFDGAIVLHLNEDSSDNRPENLRWGTQKENLNMPKFIEYCRGRTGENSPRVKGMRK